MDIQLFSRGCFWASIFALAVLLVRLYSSGLLRSYPRFSLFVATYLIWGLALTPLDPRLRSYLFIWAAAQTHFTLLECLVVYEILLECMSHFPRAARFALGTSCAAFIVGLVAAGSILSHGINGSDWCQQMLMLIYQSKRTADVMIVTFGVVAWALFRWIKMPLKANLVRHARLFYTFLISQVIGLSLIIHTSDSGLSAGVIGGVMDLALGGLAIGWSAALKQEGEVKPRPVPARHQRIYDSQDIMRLVRRQAPRTAKARRSA